MSAASIDLVLLFISFEFLVCILFALPLPLSFFKTVNSFRPGFFMFIGACITSAIPLYENFGLVVKLKKDGIKENDISFISAAALVYKHGAVVILLIAFLIIQHISTQVASLKVDLERMSINRLATQKQAENASKQTLKYMEEIERLKQGKSSLLDEEDVKSLREDWETTKKENEVLKSKLKYAEEEHQRSIEEINKLEKQLKSTSEEKKKTK